MNTKLWKQIKKEKQKEIRQLKKRFSLEAIRTASFSVGTDFVSARMSLQDEEQLPVMIPLQGRFPEIDTELSNYRPFQVARYFKDWPVATFLVAGDAPFLGGEPSHINLVKSATNAGVILHDFILDEVQIYQAKAIGADGLLLDTEWQLPEQLSRFVEVTYEVGLEPFVRLHSPELLPGIEPGWLGGIIFSGEPEKLFSPKGVEFSNKLNEENVPILYQGIPGDSHQQLQFRKAGVNGFLIPEDWMLQKDPFNWIVRQMERIWGGTNKHPGVNY